MEELVSRHMLPPCHQGYQNCFSTLPTNLFLKSSNLLKRGYEVWSEEAIPIGTRFGPYEGIFETTENEKRDFQWKVEKKIMTMKECNEMESNWLQYVNYTSSKEMQNMIAVQQELDVYYLTSKSIPANTELLVLDQDAIAEDTNQNKGDGRSLSQICHFGRDEMMENRTRIRHEDQNLESENRYSDRKSLKNSRKATSSNINAEQRSIACQKFKKKIENKTIPIPKKQQTKAKYDQSNDFVSHKFKENIQLNSPKNKDNMEVPFSPRVDGNKFETSSYFTEKTFAVHKVYESDESETVIYDKRLEMEEDGQSLSNSFKTMGEVKNRRQTKRLNSSQSTSVSVKHYEHNTRRNKDVSKDKVMSHKRTYSAEKIYQCNICNKKCRDASDLKTHVRIHTGEKPYKCNICGKKFRSSSAIKEHERTHTGEKPYECNVCEIKFARKKNLVYHLRIHTGEKPYECNICRKKFRNCDNLKIHQRIHTGEKPYECNICSRKFTRRIGLILHERIHTNEKPYECNECGKKFRSNANLKVHQRIHTGEKHHEIAPL